MSPWLSRRLPGLPGRSLFVEATPAELAAPDSPWTALTAEHVAELGADYWTSKPGDPALWLGYWQPEQWDPTTAVAAGPLLGIAIIGANPDGRLVVETVHVTAGHRRTGIGKALSVEARRRWPVTGAVGPFTVAGWATHQAMVRDYSRTRTPT